MSNVSLGGQDHTHTVREREKKKEREREWVSLSVCLSNWNATISNGHSEDHNVDLDLGLDRLPSQKWISLVADAWGLEQCFHAFFGREERCSLSTNSRNLQFYGLGPHQFLRIPQFELQQSRFQRPLRVLIWISRSKSCIPSRFFN